MTQPVVVAIEMGYGHLRAAVPLAERFGTPLLHCDRPPLADSVERDLWDRSRRAYELWCRVAQVPVFGAPLRSALDSLTHIPPLHPSRDLSSPNRSARLIDRMGARGLGRGLVRMLRESGRPLVSTFFTPAVLADRAGCERVHCVVTDSDINRVWAPLESRRTRIRYFAPSERVVRRLQAYGVPGDQITFTGFPLPHELVGGSELPVLQENLRARLERLRGNGIPRLTFAVGGAGAQAEIAVAALPSLLPLVRAKKLAVTLVAGVRAEVAELFRRAAGSEDVEILFEPEHEKYFARFHTRLADTDILWTKPSEMTFFAALGLPLVIAPPVGVHERYNRRWAVEAGAGLEQHDARFAGEWIAYWLADGTLAHAAEAGARRLPQRGLYAIVEAVGGS
jgi:UDP-N-acetylglucosamine:LPS N-acetylglucosamine transferase